MCSITNALVETSQRNRLFHVSLFFFSFSSFLQRISRWISDRCPAAYSFIRRNFLRQTRNYCTMTRYHTGGQTMERPFASVTVTEKAARCAAGILVFAGEVLTKESPCPDGRSWTYIPKRAAGRARGVYNGRSLIRVRILSRNTNDKMDEAFFRRRVRYALAYRQQVMGEDFAACRLIFGEADGFPGWTVDRYGDVLVSEVLSLGIERRRAMLYALLREELAALGVNVSCIYERNESLIREKEGMTCGKGRRSRPVWRQTPPATRRSAKTASISDVDYINGQKTGYFLDQKYNRAAAGRLAHGRRVLDCFTHTGAFALHCAAGGAERASRRWTCPRPRSNRRGATPRRNGLEGRMEFRQTDVFELLTELGKERRKAVGLHHSGPARLYEKAARR